MVKNKIERGLFAKFLIAFHVKLPRHTILRKAAWNLIISGFNFHIFNAFYKILFQRRAEEEKKRREEKDKRDKEDAARKEAKRKQEEEEINKKKDEEKQQRKEEEEAAKRLMLFNSVTNFSYHLMAKNWFL